MAQVRHTGNIQPQLDLEEHDHLVGGVAVRKVGKYNWNQTLNGGLGDWERDSGLLDVTENNIHTGKDELRVFQENHICTGNTTTTPLGANETFTGEWQDCLNYSEVNVSIVASHNSAINGLIFQWSADGATIGDTDVYSYYAANGGTNYTPNPAFRYVRMVYTNGATPQTLFSLQTILRRTMTGGSFHRIDSTLKDDQDARLNITVPKLKTAANTYVSQQATTAGNAKVSIEELESGISVNNNSQLKVTPFDSAGIEIPLGEEWVLYGDETSGSLTYIVQYLAGDGEWVATKIDHSTGLTTFATVTNNASVTTAANAWTNRATLTYGLL